MAAHRPGHREHHRSDRSGWLRAAVLGSNDAIVSTASLMAGVASADASRSAILLAGVAGLVAGAMSMAAGEYVSVSSQRDAELADIEIEKKELAEDPVTELKELAAIYVKRGLEPALALEVAKQLSAKDEINAHLRDELGIYPDALAAPFHAAWVSAASFAFFALIPIGLIYVAPETSRIAVLMLASLASLALLGGFGAYLGGASIGRGMLRVTVGGALAMGLTAVVGKFLGTQF